jgi:hypothetical protein
MHHFRGYDACMTKNPRTTITLSPATHALMKELATLNDESMSATIGGLLEQVSPVLERVVTVLRAANLAKDAVKGRLVDDLEQAQARMEKSLGLALDDFGSMEQPFLDLFEDVKRRSPKAAKAPGDASDMTGGRALANGRRAAAEGASLAGRNRAARSAATPPSNRGVRSHPKKGSKPILARVPAQNVKSSNRAVNPTPNPTKKRAEK